MTEKRASDGRFDLCLAEVLKHEGGYANHPADPGGATNLGITLRTLADWRAVPLAALSPADVRALDRKEAAAIYKDRYWSKVAGSDLPGGLDLAMFDFAVNSGPPRAIRTLQAIVGAKVDGVIGPKTLAAVKIHIGLVGIAGVIDALCDRRLNFLQSLATYAVFGRGWRKRVASIRAAARAAIAPPHTIIDKTNRSLPMSALAGYRTYIIAAAMALAGLAQMLGIDLPSFDGTSAGQLIMEAVAIAFLRKGIKTEVVRG